MEKIRFSSDEENPLEIARTVIFQTLKNKSFNQFPRSTEWFANTVEFTGDVYRAQTKFLILVNEILWELIIQRVITPGLNSSNPDLLPGSG